jgi:hypothetical protein
MKSCIFFKKPTFSTPNQRRINPDMTSFGYDEAGNLASVDRSGTSADMTYSYDLLHGWIKEISSTGGFEQKLYWEDNTGHPFYNGSISAMTWKIPGESYQRRYDYTYDGMMTEGAYSHLPVLNPHPGIINSTGVEMLSSEEDSPLGQIPVIVDPGSPYSPASMPQTATPSAYPMTRTAFSRT